LCIAAASTMAACTQETPRETNSRSAPVTNGQAADLVLGQANFLGTAPNNGGLSARSMDYPYSLGSDGTRLWIADAQNQRVMQWNAAPTTNHQPADLIVGQLSAIATTTGPSQSVMGPSSQSCSDGTRLYVSDAKNNRILVWRTIPTATGTAADFVLGQPGFTSIANGAGAANLYTPMAIWCDTTRVVVADRSNNRVLIWTTRPDANAAPANVVLGQSAFGLGHGSQQLPTSASNMYFPRGVHFDGTRLFVSDSLNHRILVWNSLPTTNGQAADYVIGQTSLTAGVANAGVNGAVSATGLHAPDAVMVHNGSLFVSDEGNNRLLVYTPVPTASGAAATAVIGQNTLTMTGRPKETPTASTFYGLGGFTIVGNNLFVADYGFHRVLRFALN